MNRIKMLVLSTVFAVAFCSGQGSAPAAAQAASAPVTTGHGVLFAKVDKTWDSSKLKEGDVVEVEMASGIKLPDGTLVPKGSKLTGHVTAAKARSKGDPESELTVTFDKLNVASGKQLAVKGTVQALFPPPDEVDPGVPGSSAHQGGGGNGVTPGPPPPPDYRPTTDIKNGSNSSSSAGVQSAMDPKFEGVHGFDNLQLEGGILTSKGKNVKLGSGDRMIVRVDIF